MSKKPAKAQRNHPASGNNSQGIKDLSTRSENGDRQVVGGATNKKAADGPKESIALNFTKTEF